MVSDVWFWVYHSLFDPGNIIASAVLVGPPAWCYHHFVVKPFMNEMRKRG